MDPSCERALWLPSFLNVEIKDVAATDGRCIRCGGANQFVQIIFAILLGYRNTPVDVVVCLLAQLLFGRRNKGLLLIKKEFLEPEEINKNSFN